jgi:hypothetical protein
VCAAAFLVAMTLTAPGQTARQAKLELRSSDAALQRAFDWAKRQALEYVNDGGAVGPWYEAALPKRRAFCMRDVSHQALGAQALGLAAYNANMLRKFAKNIAASRDWCSYWEIDADNKPAPVDYKDDKNFWYNLPANYDVLDACYRMYLWTGDETYLRDPEFVTFYRRTMKEYAESWEIGRDKVMTRNRVVPGAPYFRGDPSYAESRTDIMVGADLLAAQVAAHRSYAAMAELRGEKETARTEQQQAKALVELLNTTWWNPAAGRYYGFLDERHTMRGEAAADLLYRGATERGAKTDAAVELLRRAARAIAETEVEPASYFAETLYRYGAADEAYQSILNLSSPGRKRQEYPEVSYSVIGAIVSGTMGLNVRRGAKAGFTVETLPQLTKQTEWAELLHMPLRGGAVSVKHEANRATTLTNEGTAVLTWRACFTGQHAELMVDGKSVKTAKSDESAEVDRSCVAVPVRPGASVQARIP